MANRIASRGAWALLCTLAIGFAGCSKPAADAGPPPNTPPQVPASVINQMQRLSPEERQRVQQQMQNTPQGPQVQQALGAQGGNAPSSGGQ
ncbi:MAG TPA: hypothetical protein VKU00_27460 [Chthonomonadaceae bacterium]|nr:hypothetical protein [Chthonomonadaceae bacterium]